MRFAAAAFVVTLLLACRGEKSEEPPPRPPADAAIDATTGEVDPNLGAHLDDHEPTAPRRSKGGPPIGIMLKSEPMGATVYVDNIELGETPRYWTGVADGSEHVFVYALAGYASARYKFVPIANGTLHPTLVRVAGGETLDAGLPPVIAPKQAPDAAVAPPPTVPADAAPTVSGDAAVRTPGDAALEPDATMVDAALPSD